VVSGAYDAAEAHLDEADPQIRVYEALHGRAGMGHEGHIALHDTMVRDSRLPPRGYRPLPGHEPVGVDYSGGESGALRHWDDATYNITIPTVVRSPVTVRVRARYQTTTREYVEFLASENHTDDRGSELLRRYNESGRAAPFDMAEATAVIMVTGGTAPDAGATADGAMAPAEAGGGGCNCTTAGTGRPAGRTGAALALGLAAIVATSRRRHPRPR
jgi:MYXO-CTERM domain-containing protein